MIKHPVDAETAQRFIDNDFHDRGMMKWQGFMLSDHTAYIEREKHLAAKIVKGQQPFTTIKSLIIQSINEHRQVMIQANYISSSQLIEFRGSIKGIQSERIFIKTINGLETLPLNSIRNVHFMVNK